MEANFTPVIFCAGHAVHNGKTGFAYCYDIGVQLSVGQLHAKLSIYFKAVVSTEILETGIPALRQGESRPGIIDECFLAAIDARDSIVIKIP